MKKVLCICALGKNRSKYLSEYLSRKGYETRYGGVNCWKKKGCNPINSKDVKWAEVIIIVRKKLEKKFDAKYTTRKKTIILEVTDSKKIAARKNKKWLKKDYKTFKKEYVEPRLRRGIRPYLPL